MSDTIDRTLRAEANARWARVAFQRLLTLAPDGAERAELLAAGVPSHRVDALYPHSNYRELVPGIIEHLRANLDGITMWLVMEADPHFLTTTAPLSAGYQHEKENLYKEARGFPLLHEFFGNNTRYVMGEIQSVQSLLWHAHWMMSHRQQLIDAQKQTADELMLSAIGYILPNLKTPGQPRYV